MQPLIAIFGVLPSVVFDDQLQSFAWALTPWREVRPAFPDTFT
jgi:hypothetical protein